MPRESSLWKWIKRGGLPGTWRRVDAPGFPDCLVHYRENYISPKGKARTDRSFVVELKEVSHWTRARTIILPLRPGQLSFFNTWPGEAYVLVRVNGGLFWFDGKKRKVSLRDSIKGPFLGAFKRALDTSNYKI